MIVDSSTPGYFPVPLFDFPPLALSPPCVCVCVCVSLFSIDRANRLTNEDVSAVAGKKYVCVCMCVCVCVCVCVRARVRPRVRARYCLNVLVAGKHVVDVDGFSSYIWC